MLANFVKYTGADKADGFGVYAWSAMIAFRDAVNTDRQGGRRQRRHPQDDLRSS